MKVWQTVIGIILFATSSMLADLVTLTGFSLSIGGTDYAVDVTRKILDVMAGSMIVWGVLDIGKPKKGRR